MTSDKPAPLYATPSVLVIGDRANAIARAAAAVVAAGLLVTARVDLEDAEAALSDGPTPAVVFVEIAGSPVGGEAESLDRLLVRLDNETRSGRFAALVSTPAALIDVVAGRLRSGRVGQLADASDDDRMLALAAGATQRTDAAVRDSTGRAPGGEAARLRYLTDEVGRIAAALARLSGGAVRANGVSDEPQAPAANAGADEADANAADANATDRRELSRIVRARRLRGRHFDPALFADPAWDMLLDLTAARIAGKPVAVSSLCIAAAVPATTALRWLRMMTEAGLFVRHADPADGRRVFIDLSDDAATAMRAYLAALRSES